MAGSVDYLVFLGARSSRRLVLVPPLERDSLVFRVLVELKKVGYGRRQRWARLLAYHGSHYLIEALR